MILKCKLNKSFSPQLGFGHGFITTIITLTRSFTLVFFTITRHGAVILKTVEYSIRLVHLRLCFQSFSVGVVLGVVLRC